MPVELSGALEIEELAKRYGALPSDVAARFRYNRRHVRILRAGGYA
jgi:hypothetical protein